MCFGNLIETATNNNYNKLTLKVTLQLTLILINTSNRYLSIVCRFFDKFHHSHQFICHLLTKLKKKKNNNAKKHSQIYQIYSNEKYHVNNKLILKFP